MRSLSAAHVVVGSGSRVAGRVIPMVALRVSPGIWAGTTRSITSTFVTTEMSSDEPTHWTGNRMSLLDSEPADGPRFVLAAVDDSSSGQHAALYAAGLARRNRARLAYLYVRRPIPAVLWFEALGGPLEEGPEDGYASALLDELVEMSERTYGIRAEKIVAEGTPAREIARIADARHVDAVVVGCSRHLIHRVVGSTSRWLVTHGHWPVMVVP